MSRSSQAFGGDSLSTTRSGAPATIARRWAAQVPMFRNGPPPHCTFHCKTDTSRSPGPGRSVAPEPVIVQADQAGANTVQISLNRGAMPQEMFLEQIRRFARDVLPVLQAHEVKVAPVAAAAAD